MFFLKICRNTFKFNNEKRKQLYAKILIAYYLNNHFVNRKLIRHNSKLKITDENLIISADLSNRYLKS